jgi:hypothetical protein
LWGGQGGGKKDLFLPLVQRLYLSLPLVGRVREGVRKSIANKPANLFYGRAICVPLPLVERLYRSLPLVERLSLSLPLVGRVREGVRKSIANKPANLFYGRAICVPLPLVERLYRSLPLVGRAGRG